MERNFTNENFEEFLRRHSNGLRMRPSERVWKNINSALHDRRRRYGLIALLFVTFSTFGYYLTQQHPAASKASRPTTTTTKQIAATVREVPALSLTSSPVKAGNPGRMPVTRIDYIHDQPFSTGGSSFILPLLPTAGGQQDGPISLFSGNAEWTPSLVDEYEPLTLPGVAPVASLPAPLTTDPLTIESVINSYQPAKKHKIGLQLTFAPTVSYRKLGENKSYLRSVPQINAPSNYAALYSVNDIVTSKPNMGFELGLSGKYALTKKINLTGGLQFNVNRYDIKVFHSFLNVATIALNTGRTVDSLRTLTNYSSTNHGYGSDWLQNFYFQVSAPVGLEFKLRGDDRMQFGVATSIQPTYILGERVYLISTDYKNYAEVPWLTRHWNINTNLETFVSYSTGHFKWQVGPQVRYQLLSSFISKYPVKENLFDFGLKVGISLNRF